LNFMNHLLFYQILIIVVLFPFFLTTSAHTCLRTSTCKECVKIPNCGWCEGTEECLLGNIQGPEGNPANCSNWQMGACFS